MNSQNCIYTTASVSGGNPPYDSYIWYKTTGMSPWYFACTGSTTSCTTSLQDADSQTSQGYIKLEVSDESPKYYGKDIYPVTVYEFGPYKIVADSLLTTMEQIPAEFNVRSAYPNPFNPVTVIPFQLPEQGYVLMEVYNLTGQQIAVLADRAYEAGFHRITFEGHGLSSGAYFVRTRFNDKIMTQKIVLIK